MIKVGPYPLYRSFTAEVAYPAWDEIGRKEINRIYIYHGTEVCSIQTACVKNDSFVLSEKHGGDGDNFDTITLDYPSEFLTGISVTAYLNYLGDRRIGSITIHTNRDTYGPFGEERSGERFSIQCGGDFFGFHGSSDNVYLRGIGVYIKPPASPSTTTAVWL